jgi:hypothetical protein
VRKTDLALVDGFCSIDGRFVLRPAGHWSVGIVRTLHGGGLMSIAESSPYRSPVSKLVRFFCRSRDKWKAKCKAAKRENKSLKQRLAKMTKSRDRWKARVGNRAETTELETTMTAEPTKNCATGGGRFAHRSRGHRVRLS